MIVKLITENALLPFRSCGTFRSPRPVRFGNTTEMQHPSHQLSCPIHHFSTKLVALWWRGYTYEIDSSYWPGASSGYVYKVTDHIVLKRSITENNPRTRSENSVFDFLERHPTCPDTVRGFLRLPDSNFLQLLPGGTLEARLRARQARGPETCRIFEVKGEEPRHLIAR